MFRLSKCLLVASLVALGPTLGLAAPFFDEESAWADGQGQLCLSHEYYGDEGACFPDSPAGRLFQHVWQTLDNYSKSGDEEFLAYVECMQGLDDIIELDKNETVREYLAVTTFAPDVSRERVCGIIREYLMPSVCLRKRVCGSDFPNLQYALFYAYSQLRVGNGYEWQPLNCDDSNTHDVRLLAYLVDDEEIGASEYLRHDFCHAFAWPQHFNVRLPAHARDDGLVEDVDDADLWAFAESDDEYYYGYAATADETEYYGDASEEQFWADVGEFFEEEDEYEEPRAAYPTRPYYASSSRRQYYPAPGPNGMGFFV